MIGRNKNPEPKPSEANERIRQARAELLLSLKPQVEKMQSGGLSSVQVLHLLQNVLAANMFDARASASNQAVAGLLRVTTEGAHFMADVKALQEAVDDALNQATGGAATR